MYEPLLHEIDITKYYPETVNDFLEFIEIGNVENENFNKVRIDLLQLFSMRFVHDTDELGIARWEKMLKLKKRASDTVETRRMRVLAKINNKLPYTWRTLQQLLNSLFGEGNYHLNLDPQEYLLELLIPADHNYYKDLVNMLEPMIPLNIYMVIAEGIVRNLIQIITGTYAWKMNPKICGRFRTASRPGNTDGLQPLVSAVGYPFPFNAPITSRFKTATRAGNVEGMQSFKGDSSYSFMYDALIAGRFKTASLYGTVASAQVQVDQSAYVFPSNRKRCGHFRSGGVVK